MRFWLREIAGWGLVALGLFIFYLCYAFLLDNHLVEAVPLAVIGIFVFRGGIHLLKVAVAARICWQAQQAPAPQPPRPTGKPLPGQRPSMPTPAGQRPNRPGPLRPRL